MSFTNRLFVGGTRNEKNLPVPVNQNEIEFTITVSDDSVNVPQPKNGFAKAVKTQKEFYKRITCVDCITQTNYEVFAEKGMPYSEVLHWMGLPSCGCQYCTALVV
jgi:hypothetical protein